MITEISENQQTTLPCQINYRFFMILTIYNGTPPLLFTWHELDSTAEKTHPRVKTDQPT